PFSLLTYADATRHGRMIREVTTQRRMPPWHADPRHGKFANDRRLSRADIDTLADWVDGGMAKGDDKDLPRPIVWPKGWALGLPARHRPALAQGQPAPLRDALHAQRHGDQGPLVDRPDVRQGPAQARAVHERVRQHQYRRAAS